MPFYEDSPSAQKTVAVKDPLNLTFNDRTGKYWEWSAPRWRWWVAMPSAMEAPRIMNPIEPTDAHWGSRTHRALRTIPRTVDYYVLDAAARRIVRIGQDAQGNPDPAGAGKVSRIELRALGAASLRGIAFNPNNSHLYIMDTNGPKLYELTEAGALVSTRNLSSTAP